MCPIVPIVVKKNSKQKAHTQMNNLDNIVSQFNTEGWVQRIEPLGSGHINDSYLVITHPDTAQDYVLQRINHHIFTNVPELISNILRVTNHINAKLQHQPGDFNGFEITRLIRTNEGTYYFHSQDGNYWRMYTHIRNSQSYDIVGTKNMAFEGGKAFGLFQHLASDMDASSLYEILPGFHNIAIRLATFRSIVSEDPAGRVKQAREEIAFIEARCAEMHTIVQLGEQGLIPLHVTHNDTKFNNILFNPGMKAISVVDLDTVMPGYVLFDFGDAIRTGASTGKEDEADLSRINIDLALFKAYSRGYLAMAHNFLNDTETRHLVFSAKFMTYIIGLRFLTDHLNGDHYFKTYFPGHNLQRARAQFRLLQCMEHHYAEMQEIIHAITYQKH